MKSLIKILLFFIGSTAAFSLDVSAYIPVEYNDFTSFFNSREDEGPGLKVFRNNAFRVHAILHEFPREIETSDIIHIRNTLSSLGISPDRASEFGYKVEYVYPSDVEWQEETRLVFFIQKVQRVYFEKEYELKDSIYWFVVFRNFSTFSQIGYFLVSDFLNEAQIKRYVTE